MIFSREYIDGKQGCCCHQVLFTECAPEMFLCPPFWSPPPNYLNRYMCRYKLKLTMHHTHCKWSHLYQYPVSLTSNIIFEWYIMNIVEKYPLVEGGATWSMTFHQTDIYESVNIIQYLWNFQYVFQIIKYEGLPSVPVIIIIIIIKKNNDNSNNNNNNLYLKRVTQSNGKWKS